MGQQWGLPPPPEIPGAISWELHVQAASDAPRLVYCYLEENGVQKGKLKLMDAQIPEKVPGVPGFSTCSMHLLSRVKGRVISLAGPHNVWVQLQSWGVTLASPVAVPSEQDPCLGYYILQKPDPHGSTLAQRHSKLRPSCCGMVYTV